MSTTPTVSAPTWDLEVFFPGGSTSAKFADYREKAKADLANAARMLADLPVTLDSASTAAWSEFVLMLGDLADRIECIGSFAHCLVSQNVDDTPAHALEAEGDTLSAEWEKLKTAFEALTLKQTDQAWAALLATDELKDVAFYLSRLREQAKDKMPPELESLALDLGINGLHAWNKLYGKMAGDLRAEFEQDGQTESLSIGQLAAKMSDPDRDVRHRAFKAITSAWKTREDLAAMNLNALIGFRLKLYERRNWESPLHEALRVSRLSKPTLDAMWSVISRETPKLKAYIDAKKKLLGIDKYSWWDQFAPCGAVEKSYTYGEAADFIIENKGKFSPEMADFCRTAIDQRWIEAEDRPGKMGGGYWTDFGPFKQSRIFMTYANTYENLLTLAHELGHAYHQWVLKDRKPFAQIYPMTLAETASIFAELLVTDAALSACDDPREKLMLIDQKLQQPYTFFCDIHCRYLFDQAWHNERKKGVVGKERLGEMMLEAQGRAYGGLLDESGRHPLFWCTKLHFYICDVPFYNFPYTFGFLFAGGVYDRARREGPVFAKKYRALLEDTGSMTTEDVAAKHLGVDLTKEDFWNDSVARALGDIDEFVKLAEQVG
jgi:pepF/M3 family oligoendopeptidase